MPRQVTLKFFLFLLVLAACASPSDVAAPVAVVPIETASAEVAVPPENRRFLGFLRRKPRDEIEVVVPATEPLVPGEAEASGDTVVLAAAVPETVDPAPAPPRRRGLFGLFNRRDRSGNETDPQGAAERPVAGGLPRFGEVVVVCGLSRAEIGAEIARSDGRGAYRLHDTSPGSVEPRMHYLTGFNDGCARGFTAALALFGSTDVHEATRYNPLNDSPWTETDTAYERIKTRVCRVGRGKPCPRARAGRLARDTALMTVYRGFGETEIWLELLMHDGDLAAYSLRGG